MRTLRPTSGQSPFLANKSVPAGLSGDATTKTQGQAPALQ